MTSPYAFADHDRPLRLLVVDDQRVDRALLAERLHKLLPPKSSVEEAETGVAALAAANRAAVPYDCILLDMNLPDGDGANLIDQLLLPMPEASIVMITGERDMTKALQCLQAGAEDFLTKGDYSNEDLYRAIRYAMERRQSRMENFRLSHALTRERAFAAMQKEFIYLVSHEFRTPMTIISSAVQLLALKMPELKEGAGAAQFAKIHGAIGRLLSLLDNVIRLSKLEEGKIECRHEPFDMLQAIDYACNNFPDANLVRDLPSAALPCMGDHALIEYSLQNVIGNAIKYSPPGAEVAIAARLLAEGIEILVSDQGVGMTAEVLAQAGDRFYRASATSHIEGTGLGIYLARRFMEYHRGTLTMCSAPGAGTTVRLFFPREVKAS